MFDNMKPLAKSAFPRIYKTLALLVPKRAKPLSSSSHSRLKGILMKTQATTDANIDTMN